MCTGLIVNERKIVASGEQLTARMSVGYKNIRESFLTRVELKPDEPRIDVAYLDGPFKNLDNRWRFLSRPDGGSIVDFYITYEFKNALLGVLVGGMFDQAFRKFAEAFERRAEQVYGAKTGV
jgi:coenzyme Q-binding protein COQ10